jgi:general secretion pathway protein A
VYRNFFGLREHPFSINPDPRYLFFTPQTRDAFDALVFGIERRQGLVLLTGEVGTGKTTLINHLRDWLRQQRTPTAFVSNPHLETQHLFDFMLAEFGVSSSPRTSSNPRTLLNECLLERAGRNSVLIVDEAQGLSVELLEEIRLLLNLETSREKLLQVVLVGQPELEETLARPELRRLRQRIALRCKIAPLTCEETQAYIHARLRIAGSDEKEIFEPEAVDALHSYARGIPRVINLLGEHSLICAYVRNLQLVTAAIVDEGAREFQLDGARRPVRPPDLGGATRTQSTSFKSTFPGPFVVARPMTPTNSGSKADPPVYESTSARKAFTEAMRRETEQFLSAELTSEAAFRLLCELALKSQTIAAAPAIYEVESSRDVPAPAQPSSASHLETSASRLMTKYGTVPPVQSTSEPQNRKLRARRVRRRAWRAMHWSASAPSVGLARIVVDLLQSLKPLPNPVELMQQRWLTWRDRSSIKAVREMTTPLIRWLQEPWGPVTTSFPAGAIHSRGRPIR